MYSVLAAPTSSLSFSLFSRFRVAISEEIFFISIDIFYAELGLHITDYRSLIRDQDYPEVESYLPPFTSLLSPQATSRKFNVSTVVLVVVHACELHDTLSLDYVSVKYIHLEMRVVCFLTRRHQSKLFIGCLATKALITMLNLK